MWKNIMAGNLEFDIMYHGEHNLQTLILGLFSFQNNQLKKITLVLLFTLIFSLICLVAVAMMNLFFINYRMKENAHL